MVSLPCWHGVRKLPGDARQHRNKVNRGVALSRRRVFAGSVVPVPTFPAAA